MMHRAQLHSYSLSGHTKGIDHQLCLQVASHRPPHDPAAEGVLDRRQIQRPRGGGDVLDIGDEYLAGAGGCEVAVQKVGGGGSGSVLYRSSELLAPVAALDPRRLHQHGHPLS